jgi:hypothetical protein
MWVLPEEYWYTVTGVLSGVVLALSCFSYIVSWIEETNPARLKRHLSSQQVGEYLRGNRYITHHYRPLSSTYREAFQSIFALHNETFNIW